MKKSSSFSLKLSIFVERLWLAALQGLLFCKVFVSNNNFSQKQNTKELNNKHIDKDFYSRNTVGEFHDITDDFVEL